MRGKLALAAVVLLFVAGSVLLLGADKLVRQQSLPAFSAHDTSDEGTSLASAYLAARGRRVIVTSLALPDLEIDNAATIFRLGVRGSRPIDLEDFLQDEIPEGEGGEGSAPEGSTGGGDEETDEEKARELAAMGWGPQPLVDRAELEWIAAGGRLVIGVLPAQDDFDSEAPDEFAFTEPGVRDLLLTSLEDTGSLDIRPVHPLVVGVTDLRPDLPPRGLHGPLTSRGHSLLAAGGSSLAHVVLHGSGELIVLAMPEIFRNDNMGRGDHLALLERLARGQTIVFDQGALVGRSPRSLLALLLSWGLGPCLAVLALALGVATWRARVRIGPRVDDHRETRTEAGDVVDALGLLYRRMLSRADLVALYHRELLRTIQQRTGIRDSAAQAQRAKQLLGLASPLIERTHRPVTGTEPTHQLNEHELAASAAAISRAMEALERGRSR